VVEGLGVVDEPSLEAVGGVVEELGVVDEPSLEAVGGVVEGLGVVDEPSAEAVGGVVEGLGVVDEPGVKAVGGVVEGLGVVEEAGGGGELVVGGGRGEAPGALESHVEVALLLAPLGAPVLEPHLHSTNQQIHCTTQRRVAR